MSSEERVVVVDEKNQVVGSAPRWKMRTEGLPHRATYVLVLNSMGELYIHKRTGTKDIYPGYYDVAAGGVVLNGESYEDCAQRELGEELGIRDVPLVHLHDFYHEADGNRVWGRVFSCKYDGDMVLQKEEVAFGSFYPIPRVMELSDRKPFTPDGLVVFERYVEQNKHLLNKKYILRK